MSNTFKGIIVSAVAIVVCLMLSLTYFITRSGSSDVNSNLDQINKIAKQYAGGELQIYNDKVVTGDEVIYAIKNFGLEKEDDKISENPVRVKIDVVSSKGTYEASQETLDVLLDRNSPYYVSDTAQYNAELEVKDNIIVKITFSLLENYYANNDELDGYDSAMASTASPTTNTDKVVPGVDSTSIEWGGDGSTEDDGVDKIEDTDVSESEWVYTITAGTATITKYKGTKVNVTVPEELEGAKVVALARGVFNGNTKLQKVTVPDCVKTIGNEVFKGCANLLIVKLPSDLTTIAPSLFHSCKSLYDVNIPSGVKSIEKAAFHNCTSLKNLDVPSGLNTLGAGAFYGCSSLQSLTLGTGVKSIEASTFFNCKSLKFIQEEGINSITSVADGAFYNCTSLKHFGFEKTTSIGDESFSQCVSLKEFVAGSLKTLGSNAFYGCTGLTNVNLEEAILTAINKATFSKCSSLKQVALPKTVTSLGSESFRECKALTTINIEAKLGEIGAYAFYDCDSLQTLSFNDTMKSIGTGAFGSCDRLGDVYFYASGVSGRPVLNGKVFPDFGADTLLHVYHNSTAHKQALKYNIPYVLLDSAEWVYDVTSDGLIITGYLGDKTDVTVPSSIQDVPVIGFGRLEGDPIAVFNGKSVTSVKFTNGPKYIGNGAFQGVSTLKTVTLTSSITELGNDAFEGCSELVTVVNTSKVTKIGSYAFSGCVKLEGYETTDNETSLGKGAFKGCESITSFIMPSKITTMPAELFSGCTSLSAIDFGKVTTIGESALSKCGFTALTLPSYITSIGADAFRGNTSLTQITLPSQLASIGDGALAQCGITELSIPLTLNKIPTEFASDCSALTKLTIHTDVESIGSKAFFNCDSLGDVYWYSKTSPKFETDSFVRSENLTFYVYNKSTAFNYANANNIKYMLLDRISDDWIYFYNDDDKIVLEEYIGADCDLLYVPDNIDGVETVQLGAGKPVFSNKVIKSISVAESITVFGDNAFSGALSLEQLSINADRYTLGDYVFKNCTKLDNLDITGAESITIGLFYGCKSLATLNCNTFTEVPAYCFYDCRVLDLSITQKLISIGQYAFYDAFKLNNFTFGDSLDNVGAKAFATSSTVNRNIVYDSTDNNAVFDKSAFDKATVDVKVYPYSSAETKFNKDHYLFRFSGAEQINLTYYSIAGIEIASQPNAMVYFIGEKFLPDGIAVNCKFANTSKKTRVWSDVDGYSWTYEEPETTLGKRKVTVNLKYPKSNPTSVFTCQTDEIEWRDYSDYERYGFEIVKHPENDYVSIDKQTATLTTDVKVATGVSVNYKWQWSLYKESWSDCGESTSNTTSLYLSEDHTAFNQEKLYYRLKVWTSEATRYSNPAELTVIPTKPVIGTHPTDKSVKKGETATFNVSVSKAFPTKCSYQWLYSSDGGSTWSNCGESTATTSNLSVVATQHNGTRFKCNVSNVGGTTTSNSAKLTMYYDFTLSSLSNKTVAAGQTASFSITASNGNPDTYTYQWQWRTNSSSTWYDQSGKTSATYNLGNCYKSWSGGQVRCRVSNGQYTKYSNEATLTVNNSITISATNNNSLVGGSATNALCWSTVGVTASSSYDSAASWSVSGSGTLASSSDDSAYVKGNSSSTTTATISCTGKYGSTASCTITFTALNFHTLTPQYNSYHNVCIGETVTIGSNATNASVKVVDWISAYEQSQANSSGKVTTASVDSGTWLTGSTVTYTIRSLNAGAVASNENIASGGIFTVTVYNPYNTGNCITVQRSLSKTQYRILNSYEDTKTFEYGPIRYINHSFSCKYSSQYIRTVNNKYYCHVYTAATNPSFSVSGSFTRLEPQTSKKSDFEGQIGRARVTGTGAHIISYGTLDGKQRIITYTITG